MTRAFLAADVDEGLLAGAAALRSVLEGRCARARWVARDVMHATVLFFGDVDDERLAKLVAIVPALAPGRPSPRVRVTRIDAFPDMRRARVLVLPLEDDGALAAMYAEAEAQAVALGFEAEARPFRAHLTLARMREPRDLRKALADVSVGLDGRVHALTLYESRLGPEGPTYAALARRSFERP